MIELKFFVMGHAFSAAGETLYGQMRRKARKSNIGKDDVKESARY